MAWFTSDIFAFFRELEQQNDKAWFEANRKRYEASVKQPMLEFAAEMIERMREIDPEVTMLPKQAVFRIHRDTRFSKDKSPYKTNAGMAINRGQKTDPGVPGLYFHIDAKCMAIASGCYFLEPAQVQAVRRHIVDHMDDFARLLDDGEFKKMFGSVIGEQNKVLPAELREAAARQPLLFNKQFYYWAEHKPETATRDDLPDFVMAHMKACTSLNAFFMAALA